MSTPGVSAIRLNECPVPTARTWPFAATSSWASLTLRGRATWAAR